MEQVEIELTEIKKTNKVYLYSRILWLISVLSYLIFLTTYLLNITDNVGMWASLAVMWLFLLIGNKYKNKE